MADNNVANDAATSRVPLFYGNPKKDTISARIWIARVEQIAVVQGWNDATKKAAAAFALREQAELWHDIEISQNPNITWAQWSQAFLVVNRDSDQSFLGFLNHAKLTVPRTADQSLTAYYLYLAKAGRSWAESMPTPATPVYSAALNARPGWAALPDADKIAAFNENYAHNLNHFLQFSLMGFYYGGVSQQLKAHLRDKNATTLLEMKNVCEDFEAHNKAAAVRVNAVDDIDAVRHQFKRASTSAGKTPQRPKT